MGNDNRNFLPVTPFPHEKAQDAHAQARIADIVGSRHGLFYPKQGEIVNHKTNKEAFKCYARPRRYRGF